MSATLRARWSASARAIALTGALLGAAAVGTITLGTVTAGPALALTRVGTVAPDPGPAPGIVVGVEITPRPTVPPTPDPSPPPGPGPAPTSGPGPGPDGDLADTGVDLAPGLVLALALGASGMVVAAASMSRAGSRATADRGSR
ncbi:hypothetical protein N1028_05195 [Herbiconiux sp. CPCC 203407]|uniref:Uncharacterized protein n=1 Tax=Herbiconiux oxytropis TaxID=2970915 RepID=A0AA42BTK4_9MICO|nr:hypothetical protein [Herbiconiux oxytropis]MCS5724117.1 hypothetical protein [Herbiconiux oxytropis]MCS5725286.1 hypothetical protein [Herbiconiux oxytropis]